MSLPEALEIDFWREIQQLEAETLIPYITSIERIGIQKGIEQGMREGLLEGISLGLELKFGSELEIVQNLASWVVALAKQVGAFHLFPNLPIDVYNPGFFQGTAGIGYELLRLLYPSTLPSVLLCE